MPSFLKDRKKVWIGVVLVTALAAITLAMFPPQKAKAEGVSRPAAAKPAAVEADASWSGFGVGLKAGVGQGAADVGGPGINITGQTAGAQVFFRQQFGPIVLGVDGGYDAIWGDLHTFGIDGIYSIGGSVGVLPSKNSLLYTRVEWIRAVAGGDHLNGWGLGLGAEQRIAGTPISIGIEAMHDWMAKDAFGPGVNVTADRVMLVGKWQFGTRPNPFADR